MSTLNKSLSQISNAMREKTGPVALKIVDHVQLSGTVQRVSAFLNRHGSEAEVASAFAEATASRARLIPGSVQRRRGPAPLVTLACVANRVSRPYVAETFRETASGVLVDANDQIWSLEGEGDDRRVVLQSSDDLERLLRERRNRGMLATTATRLDPVETASGDFATWVDTASGSVASGFVYRTAEGMVGVDRKTLATTYVPRGAVIDAIHDRETLEMSGLKGTETASLSPDRLQAIIDYLRRAYPKNEPVINRYIELIQQGA